MTDRSKNTDPTVDDRFPRHSGVNWPGLGRPVGLRERMAGKAGVPEHSPIDFRRVSMTSSVVCQPSDIIDQYKIETRTWRDHRRPRERMFQIKSKNLYFTERSTQ